ncbi:MAG: Flp family type IVb pilin [Pseudomonadota bacterium]
MGITLQVAAFFRDETGATAIEYALIAGLVFLAIAGAIDRLADSVDTMFNFVSSNVDASVRGD